MPELRTLPEPNELWLSRPPYLMIARIVDVEEPTGSVDRPGAAPLVSYVLYDEAGSVLEHVRHAVLDSGFWRNFQPLTRRQG
jgi:hypothetical protein